MGLRSTIIFEEKWESWMTYSTRYQTLCSTGWGGGRHKGRKIDQWNRTESRNGSTYIWTLKLWQRWCCRTKGKDGSFNKYCQVKLVFIWKNTHLTPSSVHKTQFQGDYICEMKNNKASRQQHKKILSWS